VNHIKPPERIKSEKNPVNVEVILKFLMNVTPEDVISLTMRVHVSLEDSNTAYE